MASIDHDSSPDRKRKKCTRKGPHDIIKKTAVVLREGVVFKNKETGEVFMPTTITMSNEINPDPGLRQEISFTRSYTPEDMKEVAKNAFPILANTESFSFAKAVQKAKLDFCGERHIWSGKVLNREIKGHSVLYIYYEEENGDQHPSLIAQVENMQISGNESLSEDRSDSGVETCNNSQDTSKNPSLSSIIRTSPPEPDRYRSNDNIQLFFPFDGGTENSTIAMNSLELPPISAVDHNSESEENMQNSLSTNSPNNAEVEQRNQDVVQETCQNNAEVDDTNQDVAQQISHPWMDVEEPNQNVEQEQLVCKICPSSGPLEGGGDFQISWKKKSLEHIQPGYAYFGTEVVFLTKYNESVLEGKIPAGQEPGEVEVRVFSDTYEFLGETKFEYEDAINKFVSQALQHGLEWVSNVFVQTVKRVCSQSSSVNQGSSAKQNSGQSTGALNDGCQDRSLPGANTVIEDEFEDLAQHFQDIVKWLSEQSFHPVHSNTDIWLKLSNAVDKLCRKLGFSDNFKGNQQTCPQEREENYFADTENSSYMLSEDDSTSLSDPDNWSETPNELPSKSGDDVKETWKTSTAPDDCPEKSFSPPLEDKPSDTTREVKDNKEEDLYPEVVKAAESMVTEHQFRPNNPTAGQANVVYRDGQNVLENMSLSCAGFSLSLLDASSLETASQFQQVIPSDAYGMDEEKKNGSVLKIEADPRLNSDDVSASGLPAVTSRSSWVLYSEERTSHTLSASRDDTPVPCRDIPALNVENGESQYQDDALFKPPYTNANIPKPSESILSVTSNQQSTTHPGPITQEVAQPPLSNPLWNRDSKLNMAPAQCSDEEIHSGQEWEESGEGLASWFDLCENEDAGKDEHSRWEMSSIEPNKTDGGVERDVFDSEEGLSQGQRLFSEQENSHIHLSLPDDASVQSRRPEVENKESQDTSLFTAARNGHTDIVRLLIENGTDVNKGWDNPYFESTPLFQASTNGHTGIVRLLIENGADVNKRGWDIRLSGAARNGHTDIVRWLIENEADVNKGEWNTPLSKAATNGHTDIVRLLIENGADVNREGRILKDNPICKVTRNGHTDIVKLLIENRVDVNKEGWIFKNTLMKEIPLSGAARNGHTDIVRLLIENGADVNKGWNTPLTEAARNGHTDIVRLLIENGADVNEGLHTPLCEAVINGHTDIVRLLIQNGADVNKRLDTRLSKAATNGHTDIVRLLIENGADVNEGLNIALTGAARNGHIDIVRLLIENGADVNKREWSDEDTALSEAATKGHTDIVRLLIESGADVNKGGDTPLSKAATNGHTDIVRLLMQNGANVNKGKWNTPLAGAGTNGHIDIVRLLIENGANVNKGGDTPLAGAARNSHIDIVRLLIENGADVNKEGWDTPLAEAVRNGHTDIVRLLIENGADVNKGGGTVLFKAATKGHTDIVRLLIQNGADVNKGWNTPLAGAATNGYIDIVRLLIENGADVSNEWNTPLSNSATNGHTDIVRLLIENGADVNKEWSYEVTVLYKAATKGHTDIVRLFIQNGADVNKGWDTPLAGAARNGHTDIVRLLIENGADVNKGGDTPLAGAARNGHIDIVRLLIENGADVNKGGDTPLAGAARNGRIDIVGLLIENGADVNKGGGMSLSEAAINGHTDIVRLLIQNGANVNKGGGMLLLEAARIGHADIVKLLIENGADVNKGGSDTPLSEAARNGHANIVRLLIENGADVNEGERDAPLFEAARNGHSDIVRLLKENVADVNKRLWRTINIEAPEVRLHGKFVAGARRTINIEAPEVRLHRKFVAGARVTKVPFEREYDVQLKGKKIESLPKMSGKKLITQTEMTCPRDIVEEGECGRDSMKDVELGLSRLHLSPGCEQFSPCIMDESPGDSHI